MDFPPEQAETLAIAAGAAFSGFALRNIGVLLEWAKLLFKGAKTIFGVVYEFRRTKEELEETKVRVERVERLMLVLFEKLDIEPDSDPMGLESLEDLEPHEIELVLAWRRMREGSDAT